MSWEVKHLGEIFEISRGGSPRPISQYITDDPNGINWISIKDASASNKYIYKTEKKIKQEGLSKSRLVYPDDFLLTNSMSFGRPYIMKTTGCIHDGWLLLRGNKNIVDTNYFYYLLSSQFIYEKFSEAAAGAVVKNLNIDLVKSVKILLPSIEEQRRIAAILDQADELRQKRQESINKLDGLLQATFIEMFGDPIALSNYWKKVTLGNYINIDSTQIDATVSPYKEMTHIGGANIEANTGILINFMSAEDENILSNKHPFTSEHILYSRIRPYLNKVAAPSFKGICSTDIYPLSVKTMSTTKEFILTLLRSKKFVLYADKYSKGANIPRLNRMELLAFEFYLPPIHLQKKWAEFAQSIEDQKQKLQEQLEQQNNLFNSLQQQAFSGKL